MEIKVLGTGCSTCKTLERMVHTAVEKLGLEANVQKVEDIQEIMKYGILRTPGLVVNGEVLISGSIPKQEVLESLLEDF